MSADAALLPCPVCLHSVFESTETLRDRLIFVSTNNILCPICQEEVTGIDKLTIHLFSHVKLVSSTTKIINIPKESKNKNKCVNQNMSQNKKTKIAGTKNKPTVFNAPVKYVRIYPKLPVVSVNAVPVLNISGSSVDDQINVTNSIYVPSVKTESTITEINTSETICNICGLQFLNANILKMHRSLIHNIDENANVTFSRHQCHICPKNFKMRGSLMVHMRVAHYGFQNGNNLLETKDSNECEASDTTKPNNKTAIEKNDNKQWQCDVCRKCFTTKYFLKKHKRLHTGETPYACTQCNKTFTFQQSYHKHLLYHNDEKPHVCTFCGRAFKELSTLHNHQRIHTGEKPFSCESCGKCFRQRVSYLVHRRIHTGVMPYKCTACEKSFRYKVSQRTHKCQAQPPGAVIRQTGELLEKLKKKHIDKPNSVTVIRPQTSECLDIYDSEMMISGAQLSLEDTEKDNFMLLGPTFQEDTKNNTAENNDNNKKNEDENKSRSINIFSTTIEDLIQTLPSEDNNVPSPSEILRNLCLSSEQDNSPQDNNDVIHDFFKEFELL